MKKSLFFVALGSIFAVTSQGAIAAKDRTGAEVVKAVCGKCHETGEGGAPKIGDLAAWGPRMSQGMNTLTTHAVQGYRGMPAHGGEIATTDLELTRAIIYMIAPKGAGHAGVNNAIVDTKLSGKDVYDKRCNDCHATGKEGAPKIGDSAAWGGRLAKGMDALTDSAVRGHNAMPARGGLATISDAEIRLAIDYMVLKSTESFAKQQSAPKR